MVRALRSLVPSVALALSLCGAPAAYAQDVGRTEHDVPVDGRGLHLACTGTGEPTVLFEAGGPDPAGGAVVVAQVGAEVSVALGARFCAYDRAGTGQSPEDPVGVRTFRERGARVPVRGHRRVTRRQHRTRRARS
jgi:pimeloyl-ACP methyl ester carboxylesterase